MTNLAIDITSAAPKFSKAGKMPCRSWSLQAGATCPGAKDDPACDSCYAQKGNYRFKNVKGLREHNQQDWQAANWVDVMIADISINDLYFRWFDSGAMYSLKLAEKIYAVMAGCPGTKFWLPTRMHKFKKFHAIIARMEALDNVVVRKSTHGIDTAPMASATVSVIYRNEEPQAGATVCEAKTRAGKCGTCRACWDKGVAVVAYPFH